ncbi:hypothetical protein AB0L65_58255 [Nonomuraea sp. NPDC052116]|uniref:hypothetical protein n=1 Tax=Nonomuraea sp. NPDC052116 TaxID=3155665 RepID=UPI00342DA796
MGRHPGLDPVIILDHAVIAPRQPPHLDQLGPGGGLIQKPVEGPFPDADLVVGHRRERAVLADPERGPADADAWARTVLELPSASRKTSAAARTVSLWPVGRCSDAAAPLGGHSSRGVVGLSPWSAMCQQA